MSISLDNRIEQSVDLRSYSRCRRWDLLRSGENQPRSREW